MTRIARNVEGSTGGGRAVPFAVRLAACSGGGGGTAAAPTTTTTAPLDDANPRPRPSPKRTRSKQAYLAYWQDRATLAAAPDPQDPELAAASRLIHCSRSCETDSAREPPRANHRHSGRAAVRHTSVSRVDWRMQSDVDGLPTRRFRTVGHGTARSSTAAVVTKTVAATFVRRRQRGWLSECGSQTKAQGLIGCGRLGIVVCRCHHALLSRVRIREARSAAAGADRAQTEILSSSSARLGAPHLEDRRVGMGRSRADCSRSRGSPARA